MALWRVSFREIVSRPGRALLTLLSIVIGVATVVSITIATSTTRLAYQEMFAALTGRAALEVTADGGGSFDESVVRLLDATPGVKAAAPILQRPTVMHVKGRRVKLVAVGIDPAKDEAVRDYDVGEGGFFRNDRDALLEIGFARSMGLGLNDEIRLLTRRGLWELRVAGLLKARGTASLQLGGLVFLPLKGAQKAFAAQGSVDSVQIVLDDPARAGAIQTEIAKQLPTGLRVERPAAQTQLVEQTLLGANHGLQLAASFSLLLATFIILNTYLMNVTERRRQLAILRAIGATRRQIARLLIGESLLMGAVGTVLGAGVGLAGAGLLTKALDRVLQTPMPSMTLTAEPFLLAIVFGLGISLLGAWLPARRAARLSPLEGIDGIVREDMEGTSWRFTLVGILVSAVSGAAIAVCIAGGLPTEAGILGGVFLLVGIVLLIPAVLDRLLRFIFRKFSSRMRVEVRLAHQQIPRRHARSVLTVGVLFVAAATGIGISSSILDNIQDVELWYRRAIVGDFFVRAMMPDMATGLSADLPEGMGEEIAATPGVTSVDTLRFVRATAAGQSAVVIVREFTSDAQVYFDLKSGDPGRVRSQLVAGEVVVGTVLAQKTGLKLGDRISIDTRKGLQPFRIAGLTNEYLVGGLAVYMERQVARQWLEVEGVDGYIIRANPENLAGAQAALQDLCDKHGVLLHSFADISRFIDEMMIEINACLCGILVLGFVVAAFGVVNTLTMNVLEQTRELGLLRVIAMTRRQVRKTVLSQATILGGAGLGAGTVAGLGVAYLINLATMPAIGHPVEFRFRPLLLVGSFLGAFAMVLAAAWLPAQRAARLQLTAALKYE